MRKNKGFIAISSVLVLAVVVLGIVTTVSLLSIGEGQGGLSIYNGENTLSFVEGCMEDALFKAKQNAFYTGGTITRPEGTCNITVSKSGNVWTVTATTTATNYVRTIQAVFTRTEGLTISSWLEI